MKIIVAQINQRGKEFAWAFTEKVWESNKHTLKWVQCEIILDWTKEQVKELFELKKTDVSEYIDRLKKIILMYW